MHAFEYQNSSQTLAAGIAEYHSRDAGIANARDLSPQARDFFRCHDAVHVVYGCGNSLDDETAVKIASMLGTTAGMGVLRGYALHESRAIYRSLRTRDVLVSVCHAVVVVPRTALRCLRQTRRWPWDDFAPYLPVPLHQLRAEFGIQVAHSQRPAPAA